MRPFADFIFTCAAVTVHSTRPICIAIQRCLPAILLALCFLTLAPAGVMQAKSATTVTYYVDGDVAVSGDGLSWATAFKTLQEALDETNAHSVTDYEIWVAEGTYYPDEGGEHTNDSRAESFHILYDNVQLYGGFAATETLRTQRDWTAHPTILNGNIDGDATATNNAWRVVYLDGVMYEGITTATVLDGFIITGGNADEVEVAFRGGGIYCDGNGEGHLCSPTLANLLINANIAASGGGLYNDGQFGVSSPTLTNVVISGNNAEYGGGLYNNGQFGVSSPTLTNVTISGNRAEYGGGMYNDSELGVSSPLLVNSILWGNTALDGAQVYNNDAIPDITYSIVQGGHWGTGNIDADPLFAAAITATLAPTTAGDYRLLPGSPAIDVGTNSGAPLTDIRGLPRPVNLVTDMGAYEMQGFSLSITGGDHQTTYLGAPLSQPLVVQLSSTGGEPVGPGSVITFTPPDFGPGLMSVTPVAATADASGIATATVTANTLQGSYGVTVTARGAFTPAIFSLTNIPVPLTVSRTGTGSGKVTSAPAGIDCGLACTLGLALNTQVTLTAAADTGSTFDGWSGSVWRGEQLFTDDDGAKAVTATFALNQYTVTVSANPPAGGIVSGGGAVSHGSTVTVTASANTGYGFVNWTAGGLPASISPSYSFTATGSRDLVAVFALNQYTVSVSATPPAGGTVSGGGTFSHGDAVTVTASANTGYGFVNWTAGGLPASISPSYSFTATGSRDLVAVFALNQYTVTVSANPPAGGTVSGGGTFSYGDAVTVTASANTGYSFVNWTAGGLPASISPSYSFTATGSRALVAVFAQLPQPLARNDAAGVLEGEAVDVPVLANDFDPAGGGLHVTAITQPPNGTVVIAADGAGVHYSAPPEFNGDTSFTYTMQGAHGLTSTALVVIVVSPLPRTDEAPQLAVIDPTLYNSAAFTSSMATVQAHLPAGFFTGTVGPVDIFFLVYTPVVTPTEQSQTPPGSLHFGNFEFNLTAYLNDVAQHGIRFAQPIILTIHYNPALLEGLLPATLQVFTWDGEGWSTDGLAIISHDIPNGLLTLAFSHLSDFAFFAAPTPTGLDPVAEPGVVLNHVYLPLMGK